MDAYRAERDALLKRFGATLRALRKAKFSSLEDFALEANLNRVYVYYLEQGKREPGLGTLMVLAETLGVSLDELVEGLDPPARRRPVPKRKRPERAA